MYDNYSDCSTEPLYEVTCIRKPHLSSLVTVGTWPVAPLSRPHPVQGGGI